MNIATRSLATDHDRHEGAEPANGGRALHQLIAERRTVHEFAPGPLPAGALERAVAAAVSAPNHRLTEPWRFTRAGAATRKALLELGLEGVTKGGTVPLPAGARDTIRLTIENPAELLIVSQALDPRPEVRLEDYAAVACAVQNLLLALWAEGIASKWSTTRIMEHPRTYELLGIDATEQCIRGFLWLGQAAKADAPKARRRKPLSEILRTLP